jgi:hypothetical protein
VAACTGVECSLQAGSPEALRRQIGAHRLKEEEQQKKRQSADQQKIVKATKHGTCGSLSPTKRRVHERGIESAT